MWRTKQNMTQVEAAPLTHIRSEISEQLDNELFEKINQQRSSTSLSYESVKILLMQIRTLVTYVHNKEIQKLNVYEIGGKEF